MQISRRHHTVPRLYMHAFADGNRELKVRRRSRPARTVGSKSATVEVDFYDPRRGSQPNDDLESWLARKIESPGAPILEQMRLGHVPTGQDELVRASAFVAFQAVRGRTFAHLNRQLGEVMGPLDFALQVAPRVFERNPDLTDADLPTVVRLLREKAPAHLAEVTPDSRLRLMLRMADDLAARFATMRWNILTAATPCLLTSDNPVLVFEPGKACHTGPEILPDTAEVHMPLSPTHLLVISPYAALGAGDASDLVRWVNDELARTCFEDLFCHPAVAWPTDLVLRPEPPSLPVPAVTVRPNLGQPTRRSWGPFLDAEIEAIFNMIQQP